MRSSNIPHSRKRHGLTLIELVLVVAVLAILAGFIVPRLGLVRNLAGDAGNATTVADATNQAVLYNTVVGHYPDGEDSLIGSGVIDTRLNGGLQSVLQTHTLASAEAKSLVAQITGQSANIGTTPGQVNLWSFADSTSVTDPNQDDTVAAPVTYDFSLKTPSGVVAEVTPGIAASAAIYNAAYPSSILTNTTTPTPTDGSILIALGYGSQSAINGKTGLEPPVLFDKTPGEYTRPIFLLKLWSTTAASSITLPSPVPAGTSASTSISLSFDGTPVSSNLAKYKVDQAR